MDNNSNKSSKSKVIIVVVLVVAFVVALLFLNAYEGKRDSGLSDTGDKYIVTDTPVGELITPAPSDSTYKPKLEYLDDEDTDGDAENNSGYTPYTYNCTGVITDADSMLDHVKLVCTIQNQQHRMSELAVSEQFFDYVIQGNCVLDMGAVYKYGVNDTEFFVITSDYLICGYLDNNHQICAMYYQELKK